MYLYYLVRKISGLAVIRFVTYIREIERERERERDREREINSNNKDREAVVSLC